MASVLSSFLQGEEAARRAETFPIQQQQRQLDMQARQQAMGQQRQQFDQAQALQRINVMGRTVQGIKNLSPDPQVRMQAWNRIMPELHQLGIEMENTMDVNDFTDEGLRPLELQIAQGYESLTTGQRDLNTQAQALVGAINPETNKPFTEQEARQAIVSRQAGITPRAGSTTKEERIAASPDLTQSVAESQQKIEASKERGKGEGKTVSSVIEDSFDRIGKIQTNIRNIDRAISALDRGANTGAIQKFLPSVTAASKELDQIQSELGLDIIGSVTFGALSEGELRLALETALPQGLNEPELRDFLFRKREAQNNLIDYLDQQIEFLEDGGTVGEWRAFVRGRSQQAPQQQTNKDDQKQEIQEGAIAVNPETGEKIQLINNQWVPYNG